MLASVNLTMDGDTVSAARIVIYGVAPIPWRSAAAEKAITGKRVTPETAAAAGEAAVEGAAPLSMNAYKVPLTKTVVKRALLRAVNRQPLLGGGVNRPPDSMADTEPDRAPGRRRAPRRAATCAPTACISSATAGPTHRDDDYSLRPAGVCRP